MCNYGSFQLGLFGRVLDLNWLTRQDDERLWRPNASRDTQLEWGTHVRQKIDRLDRR
jgi:hypothetical protein